MKSQNINRHLNGEKLYIFSLSGCDFYYNKLCELQSLFKRCYSKNPTAIADDDVIYNSRKMFDPMSDEQKNRTISGIKNKFYDRIKGSLPSYVCSIEDT